MDTIHLTQEQIDDIVITPEDLKFALTMIPPDYLSISNTCEHCKFWHQEKISHPWGLCENMIAGCSIDSNSEILFSERFGCIFWEGKE